MRRLPLVCAVLALVVYWITLNHWVSIQSLAVLSQVAGWNGEVPFAQPLLYLLTRPLLLVPAATLPIAANTLTAILAAVVVGILARCVQLLPQDRTHAQRIRGHADGRLLDIPLAWLPPAFAAALFAVQLTVWENATAVTGEFVHALVFAVCILCLLEFRRTRREKWLNAFAVLVGIGIANDWAMLGFSPFLAGAMFWVGGWEMLRMGRLIRLAACGACGLLLFALVPIVAHGKTGLPADAWGVFIAILQTYKATILGVPKGRFLLLAAVMLLPLAAAGIRWGSPRGSGFERMVTQVSVTGLQIVWIGSNLWFAFDGIVSPRALVTTAQGYSGIPLLTFLFCGALAVGHIAAHFLLLGTVKPDSKWVRDGAPTIALSKAFAALVVLAAVAIPPFLLYRNWKTIAVENGPILSDLASAMVEPLPKQPALVVTEDAFLDTLVRAQLQRDPLSPAHLIVNTRWAPDLQYRRHLERVHGAQWPDLKAVADSTENIAGVFLLVVNKASLEGRAFSLNPMVTFITEQNQLRPRGIIYQLELYTTNQISPNPLSTSETQAIDAFWNSRTAELARVAGGPTRPVVAEQIAPIWSRAANWTGVELQRGNRLDPAARLFAIATNVAPNNLAAAVNLAVNARLHARQPIDPAVRKPIEFEETKLGSIVYPWGPVDEPRFLEQFGDAVLTMGDPFVRASAISYARARQLDPGSLEAAIGYARACVGADEPKLALEALDAARALPGGSNPTPAQASHIALADASARMRIGQLRESEKVLTTALEKMPTDLGLLDLLTVLYVQTDQPKIAIPFIDRMLKLKPDDEALLERKGYLHLRSGEYDAAIKSLGDLLGRRPDVHSARMNRGTAHLLAGHLDLARDDFEFVLRHLPTAADAMVGLAEVAEAKKDKPEVLRMLERAIEALPERAVLRSNLATRVKNLKSAP